VLVSLSSSDGCGSAYNLKKQSTACKELFLWNNANLLVCWLLVVETNEILPKRPPANAFFETSFSAACSPLTLLPATITMVVRRWNLADKPVSVSVGQQHEQLVDQIINCISTVVMERNFWTRSGSLGKLTRTTSSNQTASFGTEAG
jgi:hypothetical protein